MSKVDVLKELDDLLFQAEEQADYCSEGGPNDAMRRLTVMEEILPRISALVHAARLVVEIVPGDCLEESDALRSLQGALAKVQP